MTEFLLILFDLIGTVAFAISGALVGVGKKMDLFGTIVLAVSTACGGGVIRDMVVGNIPPNMFRNPLYVSIAAVVAVIVFFLCYWHRKMPKWAGPLYDRMLFWFDTLGLAAFTVDGIMVGISCGYESNAFLLVFLGFLTAVRGRTLRFAAIHDLLMVSQEHGSDHSIPGENLHSLWHYALSTVCRRRCTCFLD